MSPYEYDHNHISSTKRANRSFRIESTFGNVFLLVETPHDLESIQGFLRLIEPSSLPELDFERRPIRVTVHSSNPPQVTSAHAKTIVNHRTCWKKSRNCTIGWVSHRDFKSSCQELSNIKSCDLSNKLFVGHTKESNGIYCNHSTSTCECINFHQSVGKNLVSITIRTSAHNHDWHCQWNFLKLWIATSACINTHCHVK